MFPWYACVQRRKRQKQLVEQALKQRALEHQQQPQQQQGQAPPTDPAQLAAAVAAQTTVLSGGVGAAPGEPCHMHPIQYVIAQSPSHTLRLSAGHLQKGL